MVLEMLWWDIGFNRLCNLYPVDLFFGIDSTDNVFVRSYHAWNIVRIKCNVGINKHQMSSITC
jgi:hypothetical protein